jgi:hypothetical protein
MGEKSVTSREETRKRRRRRRKSGEMRK